MRCFFGLASPSEFFRFLGPLLPPLPPDFDLPPEEEDADDPDAAAAAALGDAAAPWRACRINLSTTRKVRGSSMSTFSSSFFVRPCDHDGGRREGVVRTDRHAARVAPA